MCVLQMVTVYKNIIMRFKSLLNFYRRVIDCVEI